MIWFPTVGNCFQNSKGVGVSMVEPKNNMSFTPVNGCVILVSYD